MKVRQEHNFKSLLNALHITLNPDLLKPKCLNLIHYSCTFLNIVKCSVSRLVFGTLYPAYSSYKAVKTKDVKEYVSISFVFVVKKQYQQYFLQGVPITFTDFML